MKRGLGSRARQGRRGGGGERGKDKSGGMLLLQEDGEVRGGR